jgi:hypothetical protein
VADLTPVAIMDMHAAGRHNGRGQRGLIGHGTLRQSRADAVFFVFDVEAANWAEVLQKTIVFLAPLSAFSAAAPGRVDCNSTTDPGAMGTRDKRATEDAVSVYSYPHRRCNPDRVGHCCWSGRE